VGIRLLQHLELFLGEGAQLVECLPYIALGFLRNFAHAIEESCDGSLADEVFQPEALGILRGGHGCAIVFDLRSKFGDEVEHWNYNDEVETGPGVRLSKCDSGRVKNTNPLLAREVARGEGIDERSMMIGAQLFACSTIMVNTSG